MEQGTLSDLWMPSSHADPMPRLLKIFILTSRAVNLNIFTLTSSAVNLNIFTLTAFGKFSDPLAFTLPSNSFRLSLQWVWN